MGPLVDFGIEYLWSILATCKWFEAANAMKQFLNRKKILAYEIQILVK